MKNTPAFPSNISDSNDNLVIGLHQGMTLRDYFAGQVLCGLMADSSNPTTKVEKLCYEIADAMLKAREEQ